MTSRSAAAHVVTRTATATRVNGGGGAQQQQQQLDNQVAVMKYERMLQTQRLYKAKCSGIAAVHKIATVHTSADALLFVASNRSKGIHVAAAGLHASTLKPTQVLAVGRIIKDCLDHPAKIDAIRKAV